MICLEKIFANILSMSTIASLIFALTLCVRYFLKKKLRFSKINLLWIVFICTLIIPIKFSSHLSIKNFLPSEKQISFIDMENAFEFASSDVKSENQIIDTHIPYTRFDMVGRYDFANSKRYFCLFKTFKI